MLSRIDESDQSNDLTVPNNQQNYQGDREMKRSITAAVIGVCLLGAMFAQPAAAVHEGAVYGGTLTAINGSGASGNAKLTVSADGETMTVVVNGRNLNLDGPHAMHLHGKVEGENVLASTCPTMAEDADGDGIVTVLEGAVKYGGVQLSLTTEGDTSADSALAVPRYPAGTTINYNRSGIDIPDVLKPNLSKLHVVVHGVDENGNGTLDMDQTERSSLTDDLPREATAPALCGTLTVLAIGPIQTGVGGTAATNSSATAAALGAALITIAGATLVARRRTERTGTSS